MAKIKICGLRRVQDIEYANQLKPDYIGFILTDGFRRSITKETAKELRALLSPDIKAVGVFVNDSKENIDFFIKNDIIDLVQLHGDESPEFCKSINAPLIKYFNQKSFDKVDDYDTPYLLFDSGTGTGKSFDWSMIPKTNKPFFLAGGISRDNIRRAIEKINPYCIDLSSAVETNGIKDFDKIKEVIELVRK